MPDLTHGAYQSPVEQAMETAALPYLRALLDVPSPWDADHISESMLEHLAFTLKADGWTPELANIDYRRLIVRDAIYLHRHRGFPEALTRFALRASFSIFWVLTRSGTPERNTGIDIYVTPSVFQAATPVWVAYISAVLARLLPYWITLNFISVLPAIGGTVRSAGVFQVTGFVSLGV